MARSGTGFSAFSDERYADEASIGGVPHRGVQAGRLQALLVEHGSPAEQAAVRLQNLQTVQESDQVGALGVREVFVGVAGRGGLAVVGADGVVQRGGEAVVHVGARPSDTP